mmetsp:Transcript_5352/g.14891  ORF Transcript_5352/g.14891 Transcript_5352/m.14891 type:complete len:274 (-) Transcript_5352:192-1013(-)
MAFRYTVGVGCVAGLMGTTALLATATADAVVQGALYKLESTAGAFHSTGINGTAGSAGRHVLEATADSVPVAASLSPGASWNERVFISTLLDVMSDFGRPECQGAAEMSLPESPQHTPRLNSMSSGNPMSSASHSRTTSLGSLTIDVSTSEVWLDRDASVVMDEWEQLNTIAAFLTAAEELDPAVFADVCVEDVCFSDLTCGSSMQPSSGTGVAHLLSTAVKNKIFPSRHCLDDVVLEDGKIVLHFETGEGVGQLMMLNLNRDNKITRIVACS